MSKPLPTIVLVLFFIAIGGYCALWFAVKSKIETMLVELQTAPHADIAFDFKVEGFPFNFDITAANFSLKNKNAADKVDLELTKTKELRLQANVFDSSVDVKIPTGYRLAIAEQAMVVNFNSEPELSIGYNKPNYSLIPYIMEWKKIDPEKRLGTEFLKHIYYQDTGLEFGSEDGKNFSKYDSSMLNMHFKQNRKEETVKIDFELRNHQRSDAFHAWYYGMLFHSEKTQSSPYAMMAPSALEMLSHIMDYRLHDGPVSVVFDAEITAPAILEKDLTKAMLNSESVGRIVLNKFEITDNIGKASHIGNLVVKGNNEVTGHYDIEIEQFITVLDRYILWMSSSLKKALEIQRREPMLAAMTEGKIPPNPLDQVNELLMLTRSQLFEFFTTINAIQEGTLKLSIVAPAGEPATINGKPTHEVLPIAMQYGMPVMAKYQEIKTSLESQQGELPEGAMQQIPPRTMPDSFQGQIPAQP